MASNTNGTTRTLSLVAQLLLCCDTCSCQCSCSYSCLYAYSHCTLTLARTQTEQAARTRAHKSEILCCAHMFLLGVPNPNGVLITAGNDRTIKRWTINDRLDLDLDARVTLQDAVGHNVIYCHDDAISCMAVDGNFLFTGSDDASIRIWNMGADTCYHPSGPLLDHSLVRVLDASCGGHVDAIKGMVGTRHAWGRFWFWRLGLLRVASAGRLASRTSACRTLSLEPLPRKLGAHALGARARKNLVRCVSS